MRHVVWLALLVANDLFAEEAFVVRDSVVDCVNVRDDHNTNAPIQTCLPGGTPVTVINSEPFWREITYNPNRQGWIAKRFIVPASAPPSTSVPTPIPSDRWLTVHFIDVGQGDAIWINTADDNVDGNGIFEGRNIIIDGGPYSSNNNNPLLEYLEEEAHHLAVLDALIVTHPHIDHYAGAELITRHFEINDYYDPGFPGTSSYNAFINAFSQPDRTIHNVHQTPGAHGALNWGNELTAEFLYTWSGNNEGLGSGSTRTNNASMVLKLTYGSQSFLFMGDAEGKDRNDPTTPAQYVEAIVLNDATELDVNVLKIAHHGSETSSTTPFLEAVDPDFVIVQSGRKCFNGTHIPDMTTLQRYCSHNANVQIYRTDEGDALTAGTVREAADGDHIVLRTNGQVIEVLSGIQAQCSELATQATQQSC